MERNDELVDLGAASVETRGWVGVIPDMLNGMEPNHLSEN